MIVTAGHEVGAHGYSHENPVAMTRRQDEDVLKKSIELIEKFSGKKPRGYVAPWWEMSAVTVELLRRTGFDTIKAKRITTSCRSMHGSEIPGSRSTIQNRQPIGCIRCSAARRSI
jgi:peptidoglycan/xylan/chitin deacetylase (PgdA/CDA1 family)